MKNLILRLVTEDDLAEVARTWPSDYSPVSAEEARGAISYIRDSYTKNSAGYICHLTLAVCGAEDPGTIMGWCGLDGRGSHTEPEIFILLDEAYRNRGYGTQCVKELLRMAEEDYALQSVHGGCDKENIASRRAMEKGGMVQYGTEDNGDPLFRFTAKGKDRAGRPRRTIRCMEAKYLRQSLDLVEEVFTEWDSAAEGKTVRALVEEIRSKKYYLPELELIMTDENDRILGYAMFSRFHIEGRYEDELLILTPVAVRTAYQRQHISRDLIEYGLEKAKRLGYKAVLVEGNPKNYNPRGFVTSADYGIAAGPDIHLPHVSCLMVRELEDGALQHIHGTVNYAFYDALHEG